MSSTPHSGLHEHTAEVDATLQPICAQVEGTSTVVVVDVTTPSHVIPGTVGVAESTMPKSCSPTSRSTNKDRMVISLHTARLVQVIASSGVAASELNIITTSAPACSPWNTFWPNAQAPRSSSRIPPSTGAPSCGVQPLRGDPNRIGSFHNGRCVTLPNLPGAAGKIPPGRATSDSSLLHSFVGAGAALDVLV